MLCIEPTLAIAVVIPAALSSLMFFASAAPWQAWQLANESVELRERYYRVIDQYLGFDI